MSWSRTFGTIVNPGAFAKKIEAARNLHELLKCLFLCRIEGVHFGHCMRSSLAIKEQINKIERYQSEKWKR